MSLRKFLIEYRSVFVFGFVLLTCVCLSYWLARYIPNDFYNSTLVPILNGCIAVVSIGGSIILFRHHNKIRVRLLWACVLAVWAVFATLLLMRILVFNEPLTTDDSISLRGIEFVMGNVFAWLLLFYPTAMLRPGWLTVPRALIPFIPVVIVALIDYWLPVDLRWLLAIIPVFWIGMLGAHVRAYRKWCEENYSSMDDIDVQWICKYIIMYLLLGACYTIMSFSYTSAHAFTQQWLLLFMLFYSSEQIMFRQDPWAKALSANQEEMPEEKEVSNIPYAEYREIVDHWMKTEKPYLNPDFRLMDLRQVLPLNRTYLSQLINVEYGCSFYQFVTNCRIEEAKQMMLANPFMKMQDVAEQCGFSSPTVFARVFAREVGMPPSEWSSKQERHLFAREPDK